MAVAPAAPHFIQRCDGPVFIGPGREAFACACGETLIEGYDPDRFLGIAIQCGRCSSVTETPGLAEGKAPPFAVVVAEPVGEIRTATTTLPPSAIAIGRAEMDRLAALYGPVTPPGNLYRMTAETLDTAAAVYEQHVGAALPVVAADPDDQFGGLPRHALGWAVGHLRYRIAAGAWACTDNEPTSAACCHVAGFLHFVATWAHHPLFPAMAATAADRGCSLHGLAPFAAAHCLAMQGNRIGFPPVAGYPGRIEAFSLATGPTDTVAALTEVFDRFEFPFGRPWDETVLRAAVQERLESAQGRINLRNPGLLLLSPGTALAGFDEALIRAIQRAMEATGRKNRGLMAVAPIVLRLLPVAADAHAVQFGYGFFPVRNRHYRGETLLR